MGPEGRRKAALKAADKRSREERSETSRKAAAARGPEARREAALKAAATRAAHRATKKNEGEPGASRLGPGKSSRRWPRPLHRDPPRGLPGDFQPTRIRSLMGSGAVLADAARARAARGAERVVAPGVGAALGRARVVVLQVARSCVIQIVAARHVACHAGAAAGSRV